MRKTRLSLPAAQLLRMNDGASDIEALAGAGTWSQEAGSDGSFWSAGMYSLLEVDTSTRASHDAFIRHIHPDDRSRWVDAFNEAIAARDSLELTHRIVTGTNRIRLTISRATGHYDAQSGALCYSVGVLIDITNQQSVRKKLDDATARLMAVWEHSQEGLLLVDERNEIVDCNPSVERMLLRGRGALIGTDVLDLCDAVDKITAHRALEPDASAPLRDLDIALCRGDGERLEVELATSGTFRVGDHLLSLWSLRDVTNRNALARIEQRRERTESNVAKAIKAIAHADSRDEVLASVCSHIVDDTTVLAVVGETVDDAGKTIRLIAASGSAREYIDGLALSWDEASPHGNRPAGECVRTLRATRGTVGEASAASWRARAEQFGIRSIAAFPIVGGDRTAVYSVYSTDPDSFDAVELLLFESLAENIGLGLRSLAARDAAFAAASREAERASELVVALEGALGAVSTTLEMRDPYTAGHMRRVAVLARFVAQELGLEEDRLHGLYLAALVHDIGKIAIPAEILTKPTRLSDAEYALIRQHAQYGANIVAKIPFRWPIAEIVCQHHEYLDGSGYPRGLHGDEVLLEARILTVADIVESMTAARPYHVPAGIEGALAEIRQLSGTRLDPRVVDACIAVVNRGAFTQPGLAIAPATSVTPID